MTRIAPDIDDEYYYTVEDINIDVGCEGVTIGVYNKVNDTFKQTEYMALDENIAVHIAEAILKRWAPERLR